MKLGDILFNRIQGMQGKAFISDDMEDMPDDEVIERARTALIYELKCVEILKKFLEEFGNKGSPDGS